MDEPFTGLDPVNVRLLKEAFVEMRDRGKTLIFSTHQMETVEELCESIAIIDQGRVIVSGPVRDVKRAMGRQVVRLAIDGDGRGIEWLDAIPGVAVTAEREDYVELQVPGRSRPRDDPARRPSIAAIGSRASRSPSPASRRSSSSTSAGARSTRMRSTSQPRGKEAADERASSRTPPRRPPRVPRPRARPRLQSPPRSSRSRSIGVIFVPTILAAVGVAEPPTVAVVVEAGRPRDRYRRRVGRGRPGGHRGADADEQPQVVVEDDADAAAEAVRDGDYDALLTVTRTEDGELAFEFLGSASPTNQTRLQVTAAAQQLAIADRLSREGVAPEQQAQLFAPPTFKATPIDPTTRATRRTSAAAFILAYAIVILTFMAHPHLRQLGRPERRRGEVRPGHGAAHHRRDPAAAARRQGPRHRQRRA